MWYKTIVGLAILHIVFQGIAQGPIEGLWISGDSSRIYQIYYKDDAYEAVIFQSNRQQDRKGELILLNMQYNAKRNMFKGFIRAPGNGMIVNVKVKMDVDKQTLTLKLQRMIILPVYIRWKRLR